MRQTHRAGEKAFIDYCGPTVPIVDRHTGEIRHAQVFVGVLGASSYTYADATWTQSLPDWIGSNQRMLRFFGGVPELLVPDNLKAAVTRASRYAPERAFSIRRGFPALFLAAMRGSLASSPRCPLHPHLYMNYAFSIHVDPIIARKQAFSIFIHEACMRSTSASLSS